MHKNKRDFNTYHFSFNHVLLLLFLSQLFGLMSFFPDQFKPQMIIIFFACESNSHLIPRKLPESGSNTFTIWNSDNYFISGYSLPFFVFAYLFKSCLMFWREIFSLFHTCFTNISEFLKLFPKKKKMFSIRKHLIPKLHYL